MSHNLPPALESLRGFLPELVAEAEKKVPYASALVTQSAGETVTLFARNQASAWRKQEGRSNARNTTRFLMRLRR